MARAVPADLLVAMASRLVPAWTSPRKLLLAAAFAGAAATAARPAPRTRWRPGRPRPRCARFAPVRERLVSGPLGPLVSYATLPWVARAAIDLRAGGTARPALVLTLAVAAAGKLPAGMGLIAATLALCITAAPALAEDGGGAPNLTLAWILALAGVLARVGVVALVGLVVNSPWLVPSLLRPGGAGAPEGGGVSRTGWDGPLGTVAAWSGSGGSGTRWPCRPGSGAGRGWQGSRWCWGWPGAGLQPVLWAGGVAGVAVGLLVAAGAGLLAAAPALPKLRALVELVVTQPLRWVGADSQKFVALAVVEAVCFWARGGAAAARPAAAPGLDPPWPVWSRPRCCCCPPWPGVEPAGWPPSTTCRPSPRSGRPWRPN